MLEQKGVAVCENLLKPGQRGGGVDRLAVKQVQRRRNNHVAADFPKAGHHVLPVPLLNVHGLVQRQQRAGCRLCRFGQRALLPTRQHTDLIE